MSEVDIDEAVRWAKDHLDGWKAFEAKLPDPREPSFMGKLDLFARAVIALQRDRDEWEDLARLAVQALEGKPVLRRNVCGYCEADFGSTVDGVHERRAQLLGHIRTCEKNPLVVELELVVDSIAQWLAQWLGQWSGCEAIADQCAVELRAGAWRGR